MYMYMCWLMQEELKILHLVASLLVEEETTVKGQQLEDALTDKKNQKVKEGCVLSLLYKDVLNSTCYSLAG